MEVGGKLDVGPVMMLRIPSQCLGSSVSPEASDVPWRSLILMTINHHCSVSKGEKAMKKRERGSGREQQGEPQFENS